jgi:hypothetical protein
MPTHCHRREVHGCGGLVPAGSVSSVNPVPDVRYFWHEAPVPKRLEVTQVYGYLLCPRTGRVHVQDDAGTWNWICSVRGVQPLLTVSKLLTVRRGCMWPRCLHYDSHPDSRGT